MFYILGTMAGVLGLLAAAFALALCKAAARGDRALERRPGPETVGYDWTVPSPAKDAATRQYRRKVR